MFNPRDPSSLRKLSEAAKASSKQLEPFRKERSEALRQMVGSHYGNDPAADKVPLNFMLQAVQTLTRSQVSRNPRFSGRTAHAELESHARELASAVNETVQEIDLAGTIEECVLNAMFGMGIAKVGITRTQDDVNGFLHDVGEPFVDCVDLSDWVHDMNAKRVEAWQYCGNRYELPRQAIISNEAYDPQARNAVQAKSVATGSILDGSKRHDPHQFEQGNSTDDNDLYDMVELWDYWLPRDGLIVTCSEETPERPLAIIEWEGPESGPYPLLWYQRVPNNVMPIPPALSWLDLHTLMNALARKAGRDAEAAKTILAYSAAGQRDAERIVNSTNGEAILVDDPKGMTELHFRGADPGTVNMVGQLRSHINQQAGNIDALAGLAPQSGTIGQDKLLSESASSLIADMQSRTEQFVKQIGQQLAYYLFTDPTGVKLLQTRLQGIPHTIARYWGPDRRVGKFFQYNIDLVPRSMQQQTPEQMVATIYGAVERLGPYAQASGWSIDFAKLLDIVAREIDRPELRQIIVPADPMQAQAASASQEQPKMPRSSTREYIRRNESGQKPMFHAQSNESASQAGSISQ